MKFIIIGGGCYGIYHSGQLYKAIQKGKLPADSQLIIVDRNSEPPAMTHFGDKGGFRFVQNDWHSFLLDFMNDLAQFDPARDGETVQIVPPPYAPHLFFDWLRVATQEAALAAFEVERDGFDYQLHTPYELTNEVGNHFMSRAGWTCPAFCIEPRLCPAVKGLRDWDLADDLQNFVSGQPLRPSVSAAPTLAAAGQANGQPDRQVALQEVPAPGTFQAVETFRCHHFAHGIGTVPALRLHEARQRMIGLALNLKPDQSQARVAVGTVSHCHGVVASIVIKRR